ncbi:hypothetical protein AAF712_009010 [Marasmius tenuissimus]|uniref:Uncharacterized protein n=1 Tax=Marasmius tenuissimus TaxID=585030 RepID=A0ABR2ZT67_9AGAR
MAEPLSGRFGASFLQETETPLDHGFLNRVNVVFWKVEVGVGIGGRLSVGNGNQKSRENLNRVQMTTLCENCTFSPTHHHPPITVLKFRSPYVMAGVLELPELLGTISDKEDDLQDYVAMIARLKAVLERMEEGKGGFGCEAASSP